MHGMSRRPANSTSLTQQVELIHARKHDERTGIADDDLTSRRGM